ncbi:MAG: hypothetical protein QM489_07385 [Candidatus Izemoplasma sp.]
MFDINFVGFINYFFGMFTGFVLFTIIYTYFMIRGKNINLDEIKHPNIDVEEDELRDMIIAKQKKFKRHRKISDQGIAKLTFELSFELLDEIAKYFFPDSKYPALELSVNELLNLNHYITDRVDEILEKPILKNTKKMRIVRVMEMFDRKKQIEESKIIKAAKKYKVSKAFSYAATAVNIVNPVYWFRKLVINTSVDMLTRKVCIVIIGIVGEETTKIYSKNLFDEPIQLDIVEKEMLSLLEGDTEEEIEETVRLTKKELKEKKKQKQVKIKDEVKIENYEQE